MPEFLRSSTEPVEAPAAEAEALARIARLARGLLTNAESAVVLVKDLPAAAGALAWGADLAISSGRRQWVADALADPRCAAVPGAAGVIVAQPIRGPEATPVGALVVSSPERQAFGADKQAQLADLAALAADVVAGAAMAEQVRQARSERDLAARTFDKLFRALPMSAVLTDRQGLVYAASEVWAQNLRLTLDESMGRSIYDLAPNTYGPFREAHEHCMTGERISATQVPSRRPDGVHWLNTELTPWLGDDGEPLGMLMVVDDITELVQTMRTLERTRESLNLALSLADIHVWELDFVRNTLITSGGETAVYDEPLTQDELAEDGFARIDPRDKPIVKAAWRKHLKEGAPYRPVYRIARADGREVWVEGSSTYVVDERGRPKRLVNAIRDITARKRDERALVVAKESAEAASLAKSTFLATMSHEIRTPLNGVLGMAQAMAADELTETQRERLGVVQQSGQALLAILSDLLDLSKIEAGKLELEQRRFDVAELAGGAHAAFDAIARDKELSFVLEVDPKAAGVYLGDPTRVRQVLHNLISNALKFTEHGEVRVSVIGGHKNLALRVGDTGIGIPAGRLASLFQRFEQVDASTTRRFGGSGLGLAICSELAQLMGGEASAESVEGQGSVFTVRLPLPRVGRRMAAPAPKKTRLPRALRPRPRAPRVLAAEDNAMNQQVLRILLQQAGLDPVIVGDGRAALDAWRSDAWDLILMDVQMPVMDGPSATREIRAAEAATGRQHTQIVALTANAMSHQVGDYLAAGMDDCVAKPIEVGALYAAVAAALERASAVESRAA
ncbi:MAG TPA: ATP-binding protein [Caulobacteraceae bacterium]|jgi:PAS domain S-box-containing protein